MIIQSVGEIMYPWLYMNEWTNYLIKQYEALVEWQHTSKVLEANPVPVPFCPPKPQCGVACIQTWANLVRGWQLNAWAMTQPNFAILTKFGKVQTMKLLVMKLSLACRYFAPPKIQISSTPCFQYPLIYAPLSINITSLSFTPTQQTVKSGYKSQPHWCFILLWQFMDFIHCLQFKI